MTDTCVGCGAIAEQRHHVVYQQHVRKHGGTGRKDAESANRVITLLLDPRNLIPVCYDCHRRHHSRHAVLPLNSLPPSALEFARELMGDAADDYLVRRYV